MKCKNCKEKFEPIRFNQKYCLNSDCVKVWIEREKVKQWQTKKKLLKNELKTTSDLIKEAQIVFNKFIRLRDRHQPCISCEKPLGAKYDAGHYFSSGGHKAITFDEDNVHGQCVACNQHKHGNLIAYQIGIQKRIGAQRLLSLHEKAHRIKKYTRDELEQIILTYKSKVNDFQQG